MLGQLSGVCSTQLSLSTFNRFAYGFPMTPVLILAGQLTVLPGIYAEHYGISLATISFVVFLAGLFDIVTDPIIGFLSDRHRAKTGSRRLLFIGGMVMLLPCAWALFLPALSGNGSVSLSWFVCWFLVFYWAKTCVFIPHIAWAKDLSTSSEERTKLFGVRRISTLCGFGLMYLIPILPFFQTSKITPETLSFSLIVAGALIVPSLFLFVRYVPNGYHDQVTTKGFENPIKLYSSLLSNIPYRIYLSAQLLSGVAVGGFYGLIFIFINYFLDLGEYYVYLKILGVVSAVILVPVSVRIINTWGKQPAFLLGIFFKISAFLLIFFLIYGDVESPLIFLVFVNILLAGAIAFCDVAAPSCLADIIDYDKLKTGQDRAASFYSFQAFLEKFGTTSIGPALGIGLVGLFGFDPAAPEQTEQIRLSFIIAMCLIPIVASVLSGLLFWLIPIDASRRVVMRQRLNRNEKHTKRKSY